MKWVYITFVEFLIAVVIFHNNISAIVGLSFSLLAVVSFYIFSMMSVKSADRKNFISYFAIGLLVRGAIFIILFALTILVPQINMLAALLSYVAFYIVSQLNEILFVLHIK